MPLPLLALLALGGAGVLGAGAAVGASRRADGTALPMEEGDMEDTDGTLTSVLRYLSRPGHIVKNLAMGNLEGAARQTGDILGDTVDAFIPGNVIPSLSRKQDYPEFSDVLGGMEPGFAKTATDIVGGIATDPLTYLPPAWIAKAGIVGKAVAGAAKGAGMAVAPELTAQVGDKLAAAGRGLRSMAGSPRVADAQKAALDAAEAAGNTEAAAGAKAVMDAVGHLSEPERAIVSDVVRNEIVDGRTIRPLADTGDIAVMGNSRPVSAVDRVALHPGVNEANADRIREAVRKVVEIGKNQKSRENIFLNGPIAESAQMPGAGLDIAMSNPRKPVKIPSGVDVLSSGVDPFTGLPIPAVDPMLSGVGPGAAASRLEGAASAVNPLDELVAIKGAKVPGLDYLGSGGASASRFEKASQAVDALAELVGGSPKAPRSLELAESLASKKPVRPENIDPLTGMPIKGYGHQSTSAGLDVKGAGSGASSGARSSTPESVDLLSGISRAPSSAGLDILGSGSGAAKGAASRRVLSEVLDIFGGAKTPEATAGLDLLKSRVFGKTAESIAEEATQQGATLGSGLADEYMPRQYLGVKNDAQLSQELGRPSAIKELELDTPAKQTQFLAENPDVQYERDAAKLLLQRAEQQGTLAKRGDLGKQLFEQIKSGDMPRPAGMEEEAVNRILSKQFAYADPETKGLVSKSIQTMMESDPESAQTLLNAYHGIAPRGAVMSAIAKGNTFFKKAAVYGFIIPKIGSDVRNALSGVWQAAANPESREVALGQLKRLHKTIGGAIADSLGFKWDGVAKDLDIIDKALSSSGGLAENAVKNMPEDLGKLWKAGLFDGYTSSEQMLSDMAKTGWRQKFQNVADWPGRIFKGIEDRMRLGMAKDLMAQGKSAEEAVRITGDSLFRYNVNSAANRTARDLIPFFQFQAKAIPQAAKFLMEPSVAGNLARSSLTNLYDQSQGQVYPWMEGNLNIPIGNDKQGNQEFVSGFGLPFESLNMLPNPSASPRQFGRQIERGVVSSMSPPLKTIYGLVSGEDPYSGQPFGGYDKLPVIGKAGSAGRAYNTLAGTGMIQPVASLLQSVDKITDDRRTAGIKALDLLTGANVQSVDPSRAEQLRTTEILKQNPAVRQYTGFYQEGSDPDVLAQLTALREATKKARLKARIAKENS